MLIAFKILLMIVIFVSLFATIGFDKKVDTSEAQRGLALMLASIAALVALFIWG